MESSDIFAIFAGNACHGCGRKKRPFMAFCQWCLAELPQALRVAVASELFGQV